MKTRVLRAFSFLSLRYGEQVIRHRMELIVLAQVGVILAANFLAFEIRFDGDMPPDYRRLMLQVLPFVVAIYTLSMWAFDLFRGLWRYVGLHDLARILWASSCGVVGLYIFIYMVGYSPQYPRSVIFLTGFLTAGFLAGIRLAVRWMREWSQIAGPTTKKILIVGAGNAGESLIRDLQTNAKYNCRPVGLLDDNQQKQLVKIHGVPVLGKIDELMHVAMRIGAQEIILAIPSAGPQLMQRVLAVSEGIKIPIKTLPNLKHLLDDHISMRKVRALSLEDLLQREPVQTDLQELHILLEGKSVLVTGAGGSIGSELCRQIARYRPSMLVLFERHENSLYALDLELRGLYPDLNIQALIGDTTCRERVTEIFQACAPQLIFHAAAHKHVPLMEKNPGEAVRNNVMGTRVVGEASLQAGVERFVLISTDKAINPTNVMGATKRLSECLIQDMNGRGRTLFTVVRFGNVLGSNGSVVPLFTEQIRKGGPVTVTHPEIKRYFMTIPESVQLILQASVRGQGGDVFVLDMGEQIRVVDLAKNMIILSGLVPGRDIQIVYSGLRPGEKLHEELFEEGERVEPTSHDKIKRAVSQVPYGQGKLDQYIKDLEGLLVRSDSEKVLEKLKVIVSTYVPTGDHFSQPQG